MTSQAALEWYRGLAADPESRVDEVKIDFALCVERRLKQLGLSKTDLARQLGTSPAYVTKVLRGDANLTIKTMVELAHAVDGTLHLHIAPRQAKVRWFEVIHGPTMDTSAQTDAGQTWARHRMSPTGVHPVVFAA